MECMIFCSISSLYFSVSFFVTFPDESTSYHYHFRFTLSFIGSCHIFHPCVDYICMQSLILFLLPSITNKVLIIHSNRSSCSWRAYHPQSPPCLALIFRYFLSPWHWLSFSDVALFRSALFFQLKNNSVFVTFFFTILYCNIVLNSCLR